MNDSWFNPWGFGQLVGKLRPRPCTTCSASATSPAPLLSFLLTHPAICDTILRAPSVLPCPSTSSTPTPYARHPGSSLTTYRIASALSHTQAYHAPSVPQAPAYT